MSKIKVANPIVEIDGDEMARIIWKFIKEKLILDYLDLDIIYYDLGIKSRDKTDDQITIDAANAIRNIMLALNAQQLLQMKKELRNFLSIECTNLLMAPLEILSVVLFLENLSFVGLYQDMFKVGQDQSVLGRHAFGDQYRATDVTTHGPGKLEMKFTPSDGSESKTGKYIILKRMASQCLCII